MVIFGVWQKITHQTYADVFLTAGLLTEFGIFIGYAIKRFYNKHADMQNTDPFFHAKPSSFVGQEPIQTDKVINQVARLQDNLEQLNEVCDGMLRAMRGKK